MVTGCAHSYLLTSNSTLSNLQIYKQLVSGKKALIETKNNEYLKSGNLRFSEQYLTFVNIKTGAGSQLKYSRIKKIILINHKRGFHEGLKYGAIAGGVFGLAFTTLFAVTYSNNISVLNFFGLTAAITAYGSTLGGGIGALNGSKDVIYVRGSVAGKK